MASISETKIEMIGNYVTLSLVQIIEIFGIGEMKKEKWEAAYSLIKALLSANPVVSQQLSPGVISNKSKSLFW